MAREGRPCSPFSIKKWVMGRYFSHNLCRVSQMGLCLCKIGVGNFYCSNQVLSALSHPLKGRFLADAHALGGTGEGRALFSLPSDFAPLICPALLLGTSFSLFLPEFFSLLGQSPQPVCLSFSFSFFAWRHTPHKMAMVHPCSLSPKNIHLATINSFKTMDRKPSGASRKG